jgi:hypothetical protein
VKTHQCASVTEDRDVVAPAGERQCARPESADAADRIPDTDEVNTDLPRERALEGVGEALASDELLGGLVDAVGEGDGFCKGLKRSTRAKEDIVRSAHPRFRWGAIRPAGACLRALLR